MDKLSLSSDLKKNIVKTLNIQGVSPEDFDTETPLFGDSGLGLDSVDALELVVMLERDYGISVDDADDAKTVFSTVSKLADYILEHKK